MDYDNYVDMYESDNWACNVPPVCTTGWDQDDWVTYIFGVRRSDYLPVPEVEYSEVEYIDDLDYPELPLE